MDRRHGFSSLTVCPLRITPFLALLRIHHALPATSTTSTHRRAAHCPPSHPLALWCPSSSYRIRRAYTKVSVRPRVFSCHSTRRFPFVPPLLRIHLQMRPTSQGISNYGVHSCRSLAAVMRHSKQRRALHLCAPHCVPHVRFPAFSLASPTHSPRIQQIAFAITSDSLTMS
jgi:hypothetical protein